MINRLFLFQNIRETGFFQKNIRITFDLIAQWVLPFLKPCSPLVNDQAYHQVEVPQWEELLTGEAKTKIRLLRIQIPQTRGDNEPWLWGGRKLKPWSHMSQVTCHLTQVTCHMSHVTVIIQWFTGSERATRAQRPGYWGFQFPRHKITKNCGVAERQTRFLWPQDNEPLGWKPKEVLKLILRNDRIYLRIQEEGSQKVGDWKRVWTNIWTISWWLGTRISTNIWMIGNQDRGSKSLIIKFAFKFYFYRTK